MASESLAKLLGVARNNNWGIFIIFSLIYYMSMAYGYANMNTLNTLIVGVAAYFILFWMLLTPEERANSAIRSSFFAVLGISIALPLLLSAFPGFMSNRFVLDYLMNPVIAMYWTYWAIINSPDQGIICWLAKRLFVLWIVGLAILFLIDTAYLDQFQYSRDHSQHSRK
jgi:hypothetical protein